MVTKEQIANKYLQKYNKIYYQLPVDLIQQLGFGLVNIGDEESMAFESDWRWLMWLVHISKFDTCRIDKDIKKTYRMVNRHIEKKLRLPASPTELPENLLDSEGYPTTETLDFIENFVPTREFTVNDFIEKVLKRVWWNPDWGIHYDGSTLNMSTGGWSGNEEVVQAMLHNIELRFALGYKEWRVGGHYTFEIREL